MDLCDLNTIKSLLGRHGFHFSKSMGQNFLIQDWVPRGLVEGAGVGPENGVLEIGPGIGPLTAQLAAAAQKVVAVELDRSLLPVLDETLRDFSNVEILPADILKLDIPALADEKFPGLTPMACANLPYNITTPVITALIEAKRFACIAVMIQREVALRICAAPGTADYGAFSVYCQYHTVPELLFDVGPECFVPAQGDLLGDPHGSPVCSPGGCGGRKAILPGGEGRLRPAPQNPPQRSLCRFGRRRQGTHQSRHRRRRSGGEHPR